MGTRIKLVVCEGANGKTLGKIASAKVALMRRLGVMVEQIYRYNRNGCLNETLSKTSTTTHAVWDFRKKNASLTGWRYRFPSIILKLHYVDDFSFYGTHAFMEYSATRCMRVHFVDLGVLGFVSQIHCRAHVSTETSRPNLLSFPPMRNVM
jgi:hypothetical protein